MISSRANSLFSLASAAALLSVLPGAFAHGNVELVTIGGTEYTGYLPYQDPYANPVPERIMRNIPSNGPIEDVDSIDVQCNQGATPAKLVAAAAPGDEVAMKWTEWPDSHKGPIITYMAKAPEGTDITTWSPGTDAVWFKVDEAGLENGKWAATDILTGEKNSVWTFNIPSSLASGQYLIRHEIIALHSAGSYPGAQLYPSCIQVEVTGSGTASPAASELVSFPGAYSGSDAGITFNLYNNPTSYTIPGPALWDGADGGSDDTPASSSAAVSATASGSATGSAVASSTSAVETAPSSSAVQEPSASATSSVPASATASSSAAEVPSSTTVPEASSSAAQPPAASSSAAASSAVSSSSAASPTGTAIVDANVCMNNYNACLAASQPNPDFTTCGATKDSCLKNATYNYNMQQRARRSGKYGRMFL